MRNAILRNYLNTINTIVRTLRRKNQNTKHAPSGQVVLEDLDFPSLPKNILKYKIYYPLNHLLLTRQFLNLAQVRREVTQLSKQVVYAMQKPYIKGEYYYGASSKSKWDFALKHFFLVSFLHSNFKELGSRRYLVRHRHGTLHVTYGERCCVTTQIRTVNPVPFLLLILLFG